MFSPNGFKRNGNYSFTKTVYRLLQNKNIQAIKIEDPILTIEIGLIYRTDKYMYAATREFIEQLKEQYILYKANLFSKQNKNYIF